MKEIHYTEKSPYTLSYLLDLVGACDIKQLIWFKNSNGWAILGAETERIQEACKCMKPHQIHGACKGLEERLMDDFDQPLFEDVEI